MSSLIGLIVYLITCVALTAIVIFIIIVASVIAVASIPVLVLMAVCGWVLEKLGW